MTGGLFYNSSLEKQKVSGYNRGVRKRKNPSLGPFI